MNMKLSYRDKVIFIVVIVLIVLAVGFFVFVKAKIQESKDIQANLEIKQEELDEVHAKIDTLEPLKAELKESVKEVNTLQGPFLDEQAEFEADQYIYNLLKDIPGIEFHSMELTGEQEGDLSAYFYYRNSLAYDLKMNADLSGVSLPQEVYDKYYSTQPEPPETSRIAVDELVITMGVQMDEDGSPDWDAIMQIFDTIAEHDKTIYLKGFSASEGESDSNDPNAVLMGEIELTVDIYSVYHMDTTKVE